MGKRLDGSEVAALFGHREAFSGAGRALRKSFEEGLVAPKDDFIEEYIRLLSEASPHDMGSC